MHGEGAMILTVEHQTAVKPRRVLVVEDDEPVQRLISRALEREGFAVDSVSDAAAARQAVADAEFDLVILDLRLPDADGLDVLTQLRDLADVPTIIVSGRGGEGDRVLGLSSGADDYVVKPFSPRELVARAHAVLRRSATPASPDLMTFGDIEVDRRAHEVRLRKERVSLTPQEFALLSVLTDRPGRACSREELLRWAWDSSPEYQDAATVTEHVRRLRAKLEADPARPRHLVTVRGLGYRFDP
ncbi:MAG TPA: response regulator transcription factor [Acidimicrobiia bacterium]|nr:response regulator transcription factor [Acidimicrobiia bacterium]